MKRYHAYKDSGIERIGAKADTCMQSIWTYCRWNKGIKSSNTGKINK